jgi:putative inorganic carbon (HCO3(-)) transporter
LNRWSSLLEPLVLALLAPFALFPAPERTVALLVIPFLWIYQWRRSGHLVPRTPLDWPILLLLVMVLISLWATYDIAVSLPKITGVVYGVGLYYGLVRMCQNPRTWLVGLTSFLLAGLGVAILSLLGLRASDKLPWLTALLPSLPRFISGLPGAEAGFNPNEVAGALLWVLPPVLFAGLLVFRQSSLIRQRVGVWGWAGITISIWLMAPLMLLVFGVTQSRSGYLGLALTAPILLAIILPTRPRFIFIVSGPVLVSLIIGGLILNRDQIGVYRLLGLAISSLGSRPEIWSRAVYALQDFPFTGMGMNTFRNIVHVLYPMLGVGPDTDIGHAHNEFLQAGLDLGFPGLAAFLTINLSTVWMLSKVYKHSLSFAETGWIPKIRLLILGLAGGLIAHSLYGLTDAIALGAKPGFLFWMLLGLIASLYRQPSLELSKANPNGT